jgi:phosphate transport system permease protein
LVKRRFADRTYKYLTRIVAASSVIFIVSAVAVLAYNAYPSIVSNGLGFFTGTTWNPSPSGKVETVNGIQRLSGSSFGIIVFIIDTLASSAIAIVLAVPAGLGVAIFLTEVAPRRISAPISFMVEMLAGIPSVIYGFWGLVVLGPYLFNVVEPYLSQHLSFIPLFSGPLSSPGLLSVGIILAIMIVPIIASISRDMMARTPKESREGAKALGLTKWEVTRRIVLPYAKTGIVGSIVLGLGRALGETMAVAMLAGSGGQVLPQSLYYPFSTIASYMVLSLGAALDDPSHMLLSAVMELGLVLLAITVTVNVAARLLIKQGFASSSENVVRV